MSASRPLRLMIVIGTMSGGGAERQVIEILKHLDRTKFQPFLYLATKTGELLSEVPSDVPIFSYWNESPESWSRSILKSLRLTRLSRYWHLARILREHQIDVVYDRTYLATLDAAGGTWFRPTPRISCCVADPELELELHSRRMPRLARWFARFAYSRASLVLANSNDLRLQIINSFRLPPNHVRTFYNLVDFERIERLSNEFVPPVATEPFLVVTSGRLHHKKGQDYLLEAIKILVHSQKRNLHLVIFGQGEFEEKLQDIIRTHQLEPFVTLAGFVSNPFPWYKHARLFVLPSLSEGLPNVLIEAIACRTPVLSTDCPSGPREILDGGRCGHLVPPGDSKTLADAIADCMDRESHWQSFTQPAYDRLKSMCELNRGIKNLEEVLESIARYRESCVD